jgi:dihydroxy-acid dehydratase
VLPRQIATFDAFENAMALDTLWALHQHGAHILAIAREAASTPHGAHRPASRAPTPGAPSSHYHVEDVHRAGGSS